MYIVRRNVKLVFLVLCKEFQVFMLCSHAGMCLFTAPKRLCGDSLKILEIIQSTDTADFHIVADSQF